MTANSKIEWTDHTFNPWIGCTKVSDGCANCYAEALMDKRWGKVQWGPRGKRVRTSAALWRKMEQWNRDAARRGVRQRVFCASLADVFEGREELDSWRRDLFDQVEQCEHLDVQLLTKRPENVPQMVPPSWLAAWPPHAWIGTSVEHQATADERIPHLLRVPAAVRFLSCEPLLQQVTLERVRDTDHAVTIDCLGGVFWSEYPQGGRIEEPEPDGIAGDRIIHWVIVGGESGHGARPGYVGWIRSIVEQCKATGVPVFVKQVGANVIDRNDAGFEAEAWTWAEGPDSGKPVEPQAWPTPLDVELLDRYQGAPARVRLRSPKGGDWSEWPEDLRVREFPKGVAA